MGFLDTRIRKKGNEWDIRTEKEVGKLGASEIKKRRF